MGYSKTIVSIMLSFVIAAANAQAPSGCTCHPTGDVYTPACNTSHCVTTGTYSAAPYTFRPCPGHSRANTAPPPTTCDVAPADNAPAGNAAACCSFCCPPPALSCVALGGDCTNVGCCNAGVAGPSPADIGGVGGVFSGFHLLGSGDIVCHNVPIIAFPTRGRGYYCDARTVVFNALITDLGTLRSRRFSSRHASRNYKE